eukprot:7377885-Prymnesium_polylepis.3
MHGGDGGQGCNIHGGFKCVEQPHFGVQPSKYDSASESEAETNSDSASESEAETKSDSASESEAETKSGIGDDGRGGCGDRDRDDGGEGAVPSENACILRLKRRSDSPV